MSDDYYAGAGDGQCLALRRIDGERCTNGVYGSNELCGTHMLASDVTKASERSVRDWFKCSECGWQTADYEKGGGGPPFCSHCGVEFPYEAEEYDESDRLVTDGGRDASGSPQENDLLDRVEIPDGWAVERDGKTLELDYEAVPFGRLERQSTPGIDIVQAGGLWMLASHDRIGRGLDIEHQGIVNHGKTVDCQHLDDAVKAVEHGMERIENSVGEEIRSAHKPKLLPDGGRPVGLECDDCGGDLVIEEVDGVKKAVCDDKECGMNDW